LGQNRERIPIIKLPLFRFPANPIYTALRELARREIDAATCVGATRNKSFTDQKGIDAIDSICNEQSNSYAAKDKHYI
jgi:hypothetical protein